MHPPTYSCLKEKMFLVLALNTFISMRFYEKRGMAEIDCYGISSSQKLVRLLRVIIHRSKKRIQNPVKALR